MAEEATETTEEFDYTTLRGGKYADLMENEPAQEQVAEEAPESDDTEEEIEEVPQYQEPDETPQEEPEGEEGEEEEAKSDEPYKTLTYKGKKIDVDEEEYHRLAQKGLGFTKKSQKLSSEAKLGVKLQSAMEDPDAAKALFNELIKAHGAEDLFDLAGKMEDLKGEFDFDKKVKDTEDKQLLQEAFEGVDTNSDEFNKVFHTINTDVKEFLPSEIYSKYVSNPDDLRVLHDLIADGTYAETKDLMQAKLNTLPDSQYDIVTSNPDAFAELYLSVLESWSSRLDLANQDDSSQKKGDKGKRKGSKEDSHSEPMKFSSGTRNSTSDSAGVSDWDDEDLFERTLKQLKGVPI